METRERRATVKVGFTGHQRLQDPTGWDWVNRELDEVLSQYSQPLTGITSLAIGGDQLFATTILRHRGMLEIIIPFSGYELTFAAGNERQMYYRLLNSASKIEVLEKIGSDEDAYFEAGKQVVKLSDLLITVWNGKPAAGLGGTGDIVKYAKGLHKKIIHLNPLDRTVTEIGIDDCI